MQHCRSRDLRGKRRPQSYPKGHLFERVFCRVYEPEKIPEDDRIIPSGLLSATRLRVGLALPAHLQEVRLGRGRNAGISAGVGELQTM